MKAAQFSHSLQRCSIPRRAHTSYRNQSAVHLRSLPCRRTQLAAGRMHNMVMASAATGNKLISKSEIPAFIPRTDLASEMLRWASVDAVNSGFENFGMHMASEPYYKKGEINELWGFDVMLLSGGQEVHRIGLRLDNELVTKHEFMGVNEDGFPQGQGRTTDVIGKHFEIW